MAQSYSNIGGNGPRTAIITTTTTATLGAGSISILVDGAQANGLWFSAGQSGREVKFDLGTARLITEATWYQDAIGTHGTWQWQGSPDNSAWTSIGSTFTLGSPATQVITTLSGNVTPYRYYRMLQTAGTTTSSPFLREAEFSIDAVASTNTAWNPADLSNVTLAGGNSVATAGAGSGWVRGVDPLSAGKYYWEYTYTLVASNSFNCGIALGTANLASGPAAGTAYVGRLAGDIFVNGSAPGSALGIINTGAVVGIAVDFTAKLVWFRLAPAGNWNGSGTANPGTGAGGVNISSIATGPLFALMTGQTTDKLTANFGGTFTGAVPSGFTSGWPVAVVGGTTQARVAILA